MIKVRRGLDLPISGAPEQVVYDGPTVSQVALVGLDYQGMKPTMAVREGDQVKLGQLLFTDKKNASARYTAPAAGTVVAINRGERRVFQSLVIDIDGDTSETFETYAVEQLDTLDRADVIENLVKSGQWTALRTRPFSKVPAADTMASSIFVTAMDTNPLSADPSVIVGQRREDFTSGLKILTRLTNGPVNLCVAPNSTIPGADIDGVRKIAFSGPHPAGLTGTHIHFVDPVSIDKTVWSIGYQDVIAIGALFTTGCIDVRRVIAIAGPQVTQPRLLGTRLGANINQLVIGELKNDENRVISGSVLSGRQAVSEFAFLGRYHSQVSVIQEGRERQFLHYLRAGVDKHSSLPVFVSSLTKKLFNMTTSTNGSERAMVPVGGYEKVTALDILPIQLLRSLIVGDTEMAQKLGCLELDEDDMGLYTYVCVGKYEYGRILRDNLTRIEKEG
ncbi:MAG: Na+-transporting NADH:ubiquinone oxidoreductase subunit A [Porticoccaceae bacterium]|jgi:Na+-transporting NADH:ubiquinone oxidoreductase subunit A|nr:Na(+)-translocating NADH-quinone reductase subunit A [SAR92 clade bacterium]|tara:strand:- start:2286 stop:3626 length:1341 start_codon:yes stop_codon:yes gene_type:complete